MIRLRSTWKAYLNPSARTIVSERLGKKSSAQAPYQFSQNEVSATVGHVCGVAFHLTSEPLDLLY